MELRAADGAGSQRRAELDGGRSFAAEEVCGSRAKVEHRRVAGSRRGLDLEQGQLTDAQHAFVRQPERGAAAQAGAQTVADLEYLIRACRRPRRGAGGGNLDFAFDGQQDRFRSGRATGRSGLAAQTAAEQQREKQQPHSLEGTWHQRIYPPTRPFRWINSWNARNVVNSSTFKHTCRQGVKPHG